MLATLDVNCETKRLGESGRWHALYQRIASQDRVNLTITLSLLLMLIYPGDLWYEAIFIRIMSVWGFIDRATARKPLFWLIASLLNLSIQNLYNWAASDNHKWLMTYWYLALACSLLHPAPQHALALNARLLIGLTFLFATCKKVVSDDFLNGNAFHQLLYFDSRFGEIARLAGGLRIDVRETADRLASLQNSVMLPEAPRLILVSRLLTWWTIAIEATIAFLFLVQPDSKLGRWRDLMLMLFVITVYPVAPVLGFAWVLIILGVTQCDTGRKTLFGYLILFVLIRVFEGGVVKRLIVNWLV